MLVLEDRGGMLRRFRCAVLTDAGNKGRETRNSYEADQSRGGSDQLVNSAGCKCKGDSGEAKQRTQPVGDVFVLSNAHPNITQIIGV